MGCSLKRGTVPATPSPAPSASGGRRVSPSRAGGLGCGEFLRAEARQRRTGLRGTGGGLGGLFCFCLVSELFKSEKGVTSWGGGE